MSRFFEKKLTNRLIEKWSSIIFLVVCVLLISSLSEPVLSQDDSPITLRIFESSRPRRIDIMPPFQLIGGNSTTLVTVAATAAAEDGTIYLRPRVQNDYKTPEYRQSNVFCALNQFSIKEINSQGVTFVSNSADPAHQTKKYHGLITFNLVRDGSIDVINKVTRRDYVAGVVASEAPKGAPYEMLRAQAVLAQTLMASQRNSALIGDSTNSQCYLGCSLETPAIRTAVSSVWGERLYYKNLPIIVYYHSTCAGGTSNGAAFFNIKNRNLPYLAEVPCKNCSESPFWKPTIKEIPGPLFANYFGNDLPEITQKDYTGRPLSIKLANGKIMTGYDFWIMLGQRLGWDKAPGTRFNFKTGENGKIIVESTGAGHGVGLCQWGASSLAKKGKSYQAILRYYFPGCEVH